MDKIFSVLYGMPYQVQFKESIESGDLKAAAEVLRKIPVGINCSENFERAIVLAQGYRTLVDKYIMERLDKDKGLEAELEKYKELGTVDEVKEKIDAVGVFLDKNRKDAGELESALTEFKKLGTLEEIQERMKILKEYEALGNPGELEEKLDQYKSLGEPDEIEKKLDKFDDLSEIMALEDIRRLKKVEAVGI